MEFNKKKQILQIILILLVLPILSAVVIEPDTSIYNSDINLRINCTDTYYVNSLVINSSGTTFNQFNRDNSVNHISFTINKSNQFYYCSDLPYINSTSHTQVIIKSNVDTINTKVIFTNPDGNIGTITTSNSQTYFIPDDSSTLSLTDLITSNGDTILTLNYDSAVVDTCRGFYNMGTTGCSFIVLLIIVSSAGIILFFIFGGDNVDATSIAIVIVIVSIILVLGMIVINSFGNGC